MHKLIITAAAAVLLTLGAAIAEAHAETPRALPSHSTRVSFAGDEAGQATSGPLAGGYDCALSRNPLVLVDDFTSTEVTAKGAARRTERTDARVLVVKVGLEDAYRGTPIKATLASVVDIVERSHVKRVVLTSLSPLDGDGDRQGWRDRTLALSAAYKGLAARHGWVFVDDSALIRDASGSYLPGMSNDGTLANEAATAIEAPVLLAAIKLAAK